jgi:hypothetical protein
MRDTIELVADIQASDTKEIASQRETRIMTLSPLQRLWRKGAITTEAYRVGQCLEADLAMLMGSGGWAAVSEGLERVQGSNTLRGVSQSRLEAANRVRRCQAAVGFQSQWLALVGLLEGFGTDELDRLWQTRKGSSKATCIAALNLIVEAKVYEMLKHQPSVWAEAAA